MPLSVSLNNSIAGGGGGMAIYFRTPIVITGSSGGEQTNYPIEIDVTYDANMRQDFGDIRFKDGNGDALSYWTQEKSNGVSAKFFVKVPTIPTNPDTVTIYLYYGKSGYSDASDGDNVFSLWDDFAQVLDLQMDNPDHLEIATDGYYGENIVFDPVTNKYWWLFHDSASPTAIWLASADDITNPTWTVEAEAVLTSGDGNGFGAPHIVKFGSIWYIYYSHVGQIEVQYSDTVNTGYGNVSVVLARNATIAWENNRCVEPYVFQVGATYYMFYMGENITNLYELTGYATASDPLGPWTRYAGNPVISGDTGWWDAGQDKAADPWVFEKDGVYYVGVTSTKTGKGGWVTAVWKTTDFVTFTPIDNNPVLGHGTGTVDWTAVFRGAVCLFDGVYYFPYTAQSNTAKYHMAMTTLQFNEIGIDRSKWETTALSTISDGAIHLTSLSPASYLKSKLTFGQGYALRSRSQYGAGQIGFSSGGTDYARIRFQSGVSLKGEQFDTALVATPEIATTGAYHVFEIIRNAANNVMYTVDGGEPAMLDTQVTSDNLTILGFQTITNIDWLLVRKYINPEPSPSIGEAEEVSSY